MYKKSKNWSKLSTNKLFNDRYFHPTGQTQGLNEVIAFYSQYYLEEKCKHRRIEK